MNINITTYLNQLGYGVVGLNIVKAFARAGHNVALWVNGPGQVPIEDRNLFEQAIGRVAKYDVDAPSLRIAHQFDMAHRIGRGPHAGLTFFELNRLRPNEVHHLSLLERIYVPSGWAADVATASGVPSERLFYAPLGVDSTIFHPDVQPNHNDPLLTGKTVFFNCGKWEIRKGHDVLVEVFNRAFTKDDNVHLVMNCSNPFLTPEEEAEWRKLYRNSKLGDKITIINQRLSKQQAVASLMAEADCGVFLARAEGWNLELLEMMAMGKQVIATNYSAHTEFCNEGNARLVNIDSLEPAFDGKFFCDGFGEWAELGESQVEQAVEHLRRVHRKKQDGSLKRNEQGIATAQFFSWDNTVKEILSVL